MIAFWEPARLGLWTQNEPVFGPNKKPPKSLWCSPESRERSPFSRILHKSDEDTLIPQHSTQGLVKGQAGRLAAPDGCAASSVVTANVSSLSFGIG